MSTEQTNAAAVRTHFHTCPLCEATCGLELRIEGDRVTRVRGDRDDVFSRGFVCPKGASLRQLHHDPDRLSLPLLRGGTTHRTVGWDEAFAFVAERLTHVIDTHGRDSVALYFGNPSSHSMALNFYTAALVGAVGSPHLYTAGTVDSIAKQLAAGLMFGSSFSIAVPDVDRTAYLLILGANPAVSNGSLWTVPDAPGRIAAVGARGGRVVVVDPRRTKTAELADEYLAVRPGGDVFLLLAIANTLFAEGLVDLVLVDHVAGVDEAAAAVAPFTPQRVEARCGIDADTIVRIARELATAESAAVYGRMGTTVAPFGTVASWVVDLLNVLTGNLDRPGGAMFPRPIAGSPNMWGASGVGRGVVVAEPQRSRVRGLPKVLGEFPVATLADEILTPGDGQVHALICVAGNPVLSTPQSARLDEAIAGLELVISVDFYLNETSRHADVILPPVGPLERAHFDALLYRMAVRHVANYSPPAFTPPPGSQTEWEILNRISLIALGRPDDDPGVLDDEIARDLARRATKSDEMAALGVDADDALRAVEPRIGPDRLIDLLIRSGPYGDAFGRRDGLSVDVLEAHPHGIDAGPMEPRIPEVLRTPSGKIELAPPPIIADLGRVESALTEPIERLVLVGRRDLRSNNSWMHNVPTLVSGPDRCTLHIHPDDAEEAGVADGVLAVVTSPVGSIVAPVEVTTGIRKGVVSLPHGWGHDMEGVAMSVATQHPGVNLNVLTDPDRLDQLSGNAVLNNIPVDVRRADPAGG